jgi:hypothetical protein
MASASYDILLLFAPPGSAKSHHVSVAFPPWWMANNPGRSIIAASHSAELAAKWGRRVRNLIVTHSAMLGVGLSADSQAADRWATDKGGEYLAAGVQAGIAGFRADLGLIDDPFGSKEDAYSQRIRDRVWDWYINDFSARLKPNAKRVIMHTRWHLDDLAGRVIEQAKATGTADPHRQHPRHCAGQRRAGPQARRIPVGRSQGLRLRRVPAPPQDRDAADGMGRALPAGPDPEGGGYFKREWIKYYEEPPKNLRRYGASDYAVTADGGDYTVHAVGGLDGDGNLYILDCGGRRPRPTSGLTCLSTWRAAIRCSIGPRRRARSRSRSARSSPSACTSATSTSRASNSRRRRQADAGAVVPGPAVTGPSLLPKVCAVGGRSRGRAADFPGRQA